MRKMYYILALLVNLSTFGQTPELSRLVVHIIDGDEPMRGASLNITNSNPPRGAVTDFYGTAILNLFEQDKSLTIPPFHPAIELENIQLADSIFIDLTKSKILYYKDNKRVKKVNLR